jgi:2-C-methyl-D-erythritol 4-phosphate cytidylyltransferase
MGTTFQGRNKVLLPLAGRPLLLYSLETLLNSGLIRQMVLIYRAEDMQEIRDLLRSTNLSDRVCIIAGGEARFDSVWNGLQALSRLPDGSPEIVLIHDAARPFLTDRMIHRSIVQAREHGGATVAIPLSDTLKRGREGFLHETLPRDELYRIQTPQTFRYELLRQAHEEFRASPDPSVTDDCMLLERRGYKIALVHGEETNLKVTTPVDLRVAESILQSIDA